MNDLMLKTYLNVVISVVMYIQNAVQLMIVIDKQLPFIFYSLLQGLSSIFLHLDIEKFPKM